MLEGWEPPAPLSAVRPHEEHELKGIVGSPLDDALGFSFIGIEDGAVVCRLSPTHAALGTIEPPTLHGGTLATCIDTAVLVRDRAGRAARRSGSPSTCGIDYLRPAPPDPLRIDATCLRAGRKLAVADVRIALSGEPDRLIAVGRGTFARTREVAMFRRKRQFDELIDRQLDIFAVEHQDELREIAEARLRWRRSDVEDAEAFGDEQDRVEWAAEELEKMADAYATTLDEDAAVAYRAALSSELRKRFPQIADALRVALRRVGELFSAQVAAIVTWTLNVPVTVAASAPLQAKEKNADNAVARKYRIRMPFLDD